MLQIGAQGVVALVVQVLLQAQGPQAPGVAALIFQRSQIDPVPVPAGVGGQEGIGVDPPAIGAAAAVLGLAGHQIAEVVPEGGGVE